MLGILGIISAVKGVSDLFSSGKDLVESISGKPSQADSPEELQDEIVNLPPEQQKQWANSMNQKIDLYKAQNKRLDIEIGVDSNTTSKLSSEDAGKVAIMKQTTRPWAVRMMVHYILTPFYLVALDIVQHLLDLWMIKLLFKKMDFVPFDSFTYVFGTYNPSELASAIANFTASSPVTTTLMGKMYIDTVPLATGIIVSYMGLREIGKHVGKEKKNSAPIMSAVTGISSVMQTGTDFVSRIKAKFSK